MIFKFNKKTKDKQEDRRHGVFILSGFEKMDQYDATWHRGTWFRLICKNTPCDNIQIAGKFV